MELYNLVSFSGIFILMGVAWLFSADRKRVNWHLIVWGLVFQLAFACFIFTAPAGMQVFLFINTAVAKLLDCASAGTRFVFGRLALAPGMVNEAGETSLGVFLAFQAFPTIIFFSALMSVLYYCRIMPVLIKGFAWFFTRFMKISGAESLCASSNIFVGIEASLTIKPHLADMTRSELCTVLTAGMATVASNVLVLYVMALGKLFPNIAGHVVSASILNAPAALIMSKLLLPERDHPKTLGRSVPLYYERESNVFEAVINGAGSGVRLIVGIVSLLIAVLGLVELGDVVLGFVGAKINGVSGLSIDWSLKGLLGYVFYPFTLIIGVPAADAKIIASIIGERAIVTEVTAYFDLAAAIEKGVLQHPRSAMVAAYALCGFAHVASMAVFIGGIGALVPAKVRTLSQVGLRALLGATLACLMTACVAGAFFSSSIFLFSP